MTLWTAQKKILAGLMLIPALAATVNASVVTYSNWTSFLSAAPSTTTVDFNAQNVNGSTAYTYYPSLTVGGVTFTQPEGRMFDIGEAYSPYATGGLTSSYLNQNCCSPSGIIATFANPTYAVGLDLGLLYNWNNSGTPFNISFTLSDGTIINTTGPEVGSSNNPLQFFGFTSDVALSYVIMKSDAQALVIDNFTYTSSPSVPEPGTLALLGLGFAGLALVRRNRKQS